MRLRVELILIMLVVASCATKDSALPPDEDYFLKYYGNDGNQEAVDFVVNVDGTFVILGNSVSDPSLDQQVYVVKADSKGKIIWEKTLVLWPLGEEAKDIEVTFDGNLVIAGNSKKGANDRDAFLIRLKQDGTPIDSVRQGLRLSSGLEADENVNSLTQINQGLVNEGGFIVAGSTTGLSGKSADLTDAMHLRFRNDLSWISDASGNWKSRPTFSNGGFEGIETAVKVVQFNNNTYYVFGHSNVRNAGPATPGDFDYLVYGRTDQGEPANKELYIGSTTDNEILTQVSMAIIQSGAGSGYQLSGISSPRNSTNTNGFFSKLNKSLSFSNSDIVFSQTIGSSLGGNPYFQAFNIGSTSGFLISTDKINPISGSDIVLIKYDESLNLIFEKPFGGVGDDFSGPVIELPDGHIVMIGTMTLGGTVDGQKKIALIKLNQAGKLTQN